MVKINDVFKGIETGVKAKVTDICVERDGLSGMISTEIHMQVIAKSGIDYAPISLSLRKFASLVDQGQLVKE